MHGSPSKKEREHRAHGEGARHARALACVDAAGTFRLRPFDPSPWLGGPHLQTLGGKLLRPSDGPPLKRIRLDTPDGDFLDLDLGPEPDGDDRDAPAPLALVLHGLEGSSRRSYALLMYRALLEQGIRPVGMNFRGCSGEPNRTVRFYHSGETGDVRYVLDQLQRRLPGRRMGAVGFSLGGNVLLKHLGEDGPAGEDGQPAEDRRSPRIEAAVAVSVPFDLAAGADRLEEGPWGWLYTYYFLRMLRRKIKLKEALVTGHVDVAEALSAPTLRGFDEVATAPIHGFESAQDYYIQSSSAAFLSRIETPTLLLQARDDPFLPESALPEETIRSNPHLLAGITDQGGHVGFVEGHPWSPGFWAEEEGARFLAHRLLDGR